VSTNYANTNTLPQLNPSLRGDVIKFAGDALFVIFPAQRDTHALVIATLRSVQCALAIQSAVRDYKPSEDVSLRLHCSIAAGILLIFMKLHLIAFAKEMFAECMLEVKRGGNSLSEGNVLTK
jgi:hypothetical protein